MRERINRPATILGLIVACYLIVATLYAVLTPAWQVPDEPAHYNYARFLAENRRFPVLRAGDYPHQYLEEIKERHFPPDMPIDPIRYEFHQPPLYYLLAAGVYTFFAGATVSVQVITMRLLSVIIGACLLLVSYRVVNRLFPNRPTLALGTTAFIAFLPMHMAITAGITNDPLAELIVGMILLALVRYLSWRTASAGPTPAKYLLPLGILLGLGTLTKTTVLYVLPAVFLGLLWAELRHRPHTRRVIALARPLLLVFGLAAIIALPWFIRNMVTYGGLDILGLGRHGAIVEGQLRAADWVAVLGGAAALATFLRTTFQSFWAQFGWMGVLIDGRLYMILQLLSGLIVAGVLVAAWRFWRENIRLSEFQWAGLAALGLTASATIAGYLWYNMQFVQHQGRYLFPALISIGLLATVGLRELFTRRGSIVAATILIVGLVALLVLGLWRGDLPKLWLGVLALQAAGFGLLAKFASDDSSWPLVFLSYAGMLAFSLICLFGFIVPYFG